MFAKIADILVGLINGEKLDTDAIIAAIKDYFTELFAYLSDVIK